jgi:predicted nucleic acid-binding protein
MILVDSSVWIDHFRAADNYLKGHLESQQVVCHPFVIGELACGRIAHRSVVLAELARLPQCKVSSHAEAMRLIEEQSIAGAGLGWVDIHLLASALISPQTLLWTRDKRLADVAKRLLIAYDPSLH